MTRQGRNQNIPVCRWHNPHRKTPETPQMLSLSKTSSKVAEQRLTTAKHQLLSTPPRGMFPSNCDLPLKTEQNNTTPFTSVETDLTPQRVQVEPMLFKLLLGTEGVSSRASTQPQTSSGQGRTIFPRTLCWESNEDLSSYWAIMIQWSPPSHLLPLSGVSQSLASQVQSHTPRPKMPIKKMPTFPTSKEEHYGLYTSQPLRANLGTGSCRYSPCLSSEKL